MAKVVKTNLGYLGVDFQYKLINAFFYDPKFFKDLAVIIDQSVFTEAYLRIIVGVMKDYYNKHESTPSYDTVLYLLNDKANSEDDLQYYKETIEKIKDTTTEGIDEIREMSEKFFKQQNLVRVANEIRRIAGDGDMSRYDECQKLVEDALSVGSHDIEVSNPFDNIDDDLSKENVVTIPTGVSKIDEGLGGGLDKGKIGLIMAPMGTGKAQPLTSKVLTPNGYVLMGDIKINDTVLGYDGKPHNVIGVYPQGIRPVYKVSFSDGTSCECDINHLWNVNTYYQRTRKVYTRGSGTKNTKKHFSPDYSFKTWSLSDIIKRGIHKKTKNRVINVFKIPHNNIVEFASNKIDINPYIIGYYIGDGCYKRSEITIGKQDIEDAKKILCSYLNEEDYSICYNENRDIYTLKFKGNFKKLINNILGNKLLSGEKYIPLNYLHNSVENRILLLQGLMDSDGSCSKKGSIEFSTKSEKLCKDIVYLVKSLGGYCSVKEKNSKYFNKKYNKIVDCGISYRIRISFKDESIKIFQYNRKQERVKYRTKYIEDMYITDVQYLRDDYTQCIMVDSDEHLYITDNFIVTHNTSLTTAFDAYAATYQCESNNNKGYKVLQIVFEDTERDVHRKYFSKLTQIETCKLNESEEVTEAVRGMLNNHPQKELIKNNIRIMRLPTGRVSATEIKHKIKKLINEGFKPDVVSLDYLECLNFEPGTSALPKHERENVTMRCLENYVEELNIALWLPTQGNRESISSQLVTMDQGSGSIGKQQIAQVVMSISRTPDDIHNNKATISILKNRGGNAGITLNGITFNNGTCTIECDNIIEFDNALMYNEYASNQEEELQKKRIKELRAGYQG